MNDEHPLIYDVGTQSRDFTYIANVVEANMPAAARVLNLGNKVFNCVCREQITLNELINKINLLLKKNITPYFDKIATGDIRHSFAKIDLIKQILNGSHPKS